MAHVPDDEEMIRIALEAEPEPNPDRARVPNALEPRVALEQRRDGKLDLKSPEAVATGVLLAWRAEVLQRNRGRLSSLLWACDRFKALVVEQPELRPLAGRLATSLRIWSVPAHATIPSDWVGRRRWVEAWGTPAWWVLFEGDRERGAA